MTRSVTVAGASDPSRTTGRPWIPLLTVLIILIAICTAGAWAFGYRLNLQTAAVPIPASAASPDDVVRAYTSAYNHRDFDAMDTLYPSQRDFHQAYRHRAIGTMSDLKITGSKHDTTYGEHSHYWAVDVTLNYTDMQGVDIGYPPGPNAWTYYLQRLGPNRAWRIVDHGVG
ncbi:MAG: hypothetical protein J2P23_00740 [Microlunatus sp.]|nr:hypothetical protein [Microlunatus sp.]